MHKLLWFFFLSIILERTIALSTLDEDLRLIAKETEECLGMLPATGTCKPVPLNCENSLWHVWGSGQVALSQTDLWWLSTYKVLRNILKRWFCHILLGKCKSCINMGCFMPAGVCAQNIPGHVSCIRIEVESEDFKQQVLKTTEHLIISLRK